MGVSPHRIAAVASLLLLSAGFLGLVGVPDPSEASCVVARSFSPSPRGDALTRPFVPSESGLWSLAFENRGLAGVGIDLFEGASATPVHAERLLFRDATSAAARSTPVSVEAGRGYRVLVTPIGRPGTWASCAPDFQGEAGSLASGVPSSPDPAAKGAPPKAAFTYAPSLPRAGETVTFDGSASRDDGTIVSYAWTFGDGRTGTGVVVARAYASPGSYVVTLTVTDDQGKTGSASQTVRVVVPPSASFTYAPTIPAVGGPVTFDASGSRDPDGTIASYSWRFGDGTAPASMSNPVTTHAFSSYGTYRVTLRVTDSDGLTAEVSNRITVYAPPTAAFAYAPAQPLVGETVTFDASASSDPDSAILSYAWDFGDGTGGSGRIVGHAYPAAGVYAVVLRVTGSDGLSATARKDVTVPGPPVAAFAFSPAAPILGAIVTFDGTASSDPEGNLVGFDWDFGDGTRGSGAVVQHAYAAFGAYPVTLTVTDGQGLTDRLTKTVTVRSPPTASFTADPSAPLVGEAVRVDASASSDPDGSIVSYTWDWGDGTAPVTSAAPAASHAYAAHGTYRITLRVRDSDGLVAETSKDVRVRAPPVPAFAHSPEEPVATKSVTFNASASRDPDGTIVAYDWDFGDGGRVAGVVVAHTFASEGTYAVTLTVTDSDGIAASLTLPVSVAPHVPMPPEASFSFAPGRPSVGQAVTFDASASWDPDGTIVAYAWAFGDGGTGSGRIATHAFSSYGTYRVTLRVTDSDGLTAEVSNRITVYAPPTAAFAYAPAQPLVGETVTFDASASSDPDSAILSYAWDFGDGTGGSGRIVGHAYVRHGSFTVALTVLGSDGLDARASRTVRILVRPSASFTFSPARPVEGQAVAFDASASSDPDGTIASYAWAFGDGGTATGRTVSHPYTAFGTYAVTLTVTDADGLTASSSLSVRVYARPIASFTFSPAKPGEGQAVAFDASGSRDPDGSVVAYAWAFGDGTTGAGPTPSHTFPAWGTYVVTLTVTDADGFTGSLTQSVRIYARPIASFAYSPSSPLEGQSVAFDASASSDPDGTIVSYAWTFGDGSSGAGKTASHTYASFGTYTVELTVTDSDGFVGRLTRSVRILAPPRAEFAFSPAKPVPGQAVTFDASASSDPDGTIASYAWDFGDGSSGSGRTAAHAYVSWGTYRATLRVTDSDGLVATRSADVRIFAPPVAAFTSSPAKPLEGTSVAFDAAGSSDPDGTIVAYAWDFGDGTTAAGRTASHTFASFGTYRVRLTVTDSDGLSGTISKDVRIHARPVAAFTSSPAKPLEGTSVSFDASASADPDGSLASYRWVWGDGTSAVTLPGPMASHTYAQHGTYSVTLQVTDNDGFTGETTKILRIHARPVASFTMSPTNPRVGESAAFDASASRDPDGTIASYAWTWGDGTSSAPSGSPAATHSYAAAGTVTVTLRVTDSDGFTAESSVTFRVLAPPVASFTLAPETPAAGQVVSFDASASSDPDGTIVSYAWTFGDGGTGSGITATHVYAGGGTYTIRLTVTDSDGLSASASRSLTVTGQNKPPTAAFTVARALMTVSVDGSASTDPEGNIATYAWTWGDGTSGAGKTASHAYGAPGAYAITLTVTDGGGLAATATETVSVASSTIDFEFWDFFNVPYGEWWDYRTPSYGDRAMNAECFNATAVANRVCQAKVSAVPDVARHPYTNWYPMPGFPIPYDPESNAHLFAPYRVRALGDDVSGYGRAAPVFLPVLNPSQSAGTRLEFDWRLRYLDTALQASLAAAGCPVSPYQMDGFIARSQITVTMDLQQSRRIFGVQAANVAAARSWWSANIAPGCSSQGPVEAQWQAFMAQQGGTSTQVGVYDVMNAFGWWYSSFYTSFSATVADDGTTTVTIDHAAWGTEVLLARWFHWGSAAYRDAFLDSSRALGWWKMEPRSLEAVAFRGSLGADAMDFSLDGVVQYHMRETSLPGPDGLLNRAGDIPVWTWGPSLADFIAGVDNPVGHTASEVNRYTGATYVHSVPGTMQYNVALRYDYVPATWNLRAGETWTFRMPAGPVAFHDPNLTPLGADPTLAEYVQVEAALVFGGTFPFSFGRWDPATMTYRAHGPVATGGPIGTPTGGYPSQPYPSISFRR